MVTNYLKELFTIHRIKFENTALVSGEQVDFTGGRN